MRRVRWFDFKTSMDLDRIAKKLAERSFGGDVTDGFIVRSLRDDSLTATYVERNSYRETLLDPFGDEFIQDRISYKTIDFVLYSTFPGLEVFDAPRSILGLNALLSDVLDFDMILLPIQLDVLKWVQRVGDMSPIIVKAIQASGVPLTDGIVGDLVAKSSKNLLDRIDEIPGLGLAQIKKIQVSFPDLTATRGGVFTSNATYASTFEAEPEFIRLVRESLIGVIAESR